MFEGRTTDALTRMSSMVIRKRRHFVAIFMVRRVKCQRVVVNWSGARATREMDVSINSVETSGAFFSAPSTSSPRTYVGGRIPIH